jgi:multidrug efflux system outer membrane protein
MDSLDIIQQRFDQGIIPEIDVNQAQIQKEIAAASIPLYGRLIAQNENALSTLLGQLPKEIQKGRPLARQAIPPDIPTGLPSALLNRRPDIAEAMAVLEAQNAQIGVAEALRYPSISLTGLLGAASSELSSVTSEGGIWSVGGGLFGPIYNFGKNIRRVEIEEERTQQALYAYENTVLTAFKEVEDALIEIETYREQVAAVTRQRDAAKNANDLARERYDQGVTSYLEFLDAERTLFSAELELSELRQRYLTAYVKLYKALGGGWITKAEMRPAKG